MRYILTLSLSLFVAFSFAQTKTFTLEDAVLGYYKGLYPKNLSQLQWVEGEDKYAYRTKDAYTILPATALTNSKAAIKVTLSELNENIDSLKRLPYFEYISSNTVIFQKDSSYITYHYSGEHHKKFDKLEFPNNAANKELNPQHNALAYTIDNNLFIATADNKKIPVTTNSDKNIVSGQAIHRFEFGIEKGTFWSPSGKSLAFYQKDETDVADYPLLDITTRTGSLNSIKYPMAGENSEYGKVGIYHTQMRKLVFLEVDQPKDWYVSNVSWSSDEQFIYIIQMNRGQDHFWLNEYDAHTGKKTRTILEETNPTFVQPIYHPVFLPNNPKEFLFLSEKDGFFNLYHYNVDGTLIKQLTSNKWETNHIIGFDSKGLNVFVSGTGPDPRENHTYMINIKSGKSKDLTPDAGTHRTQISTSGKYIIDSYSSLEVSRRVLITDTKKGKSTEIFKAEDPLAKYKSGEIEWVNLKADDGTPLYGRMIKPSNFDSTKTYPVLVYVYGGPGVQLITNSFNAGASLWMNWLAEQGYIVFTIDNRGSSNRGAKFKNVIHRQLGTTEIQDQLVGVDYLKSLPYINKDRMAVHGWSFGGFMTTSLMLREPGTFTTGVAGGPVIDWKWYEVMYGERYMDTPEENPEGFEKSSLINHIQNLDGKLMLIHGTVDDVVVMQHSLSLVKKAVEEGVQIDFFPYPMHPHNVRGKDRVHLMTKVLNYIMENNK